MKRICRLWKRAPALSILVPGAIVLCIGVSLTSAGCNLGKSTTVQITDKISSLPAGQTYTFTADIEHAHKQGVTVTLTGAGTLVLNDDTAIYLAPPAPPTPNSVTVSVTVNGTSDSDTFTITPAAGPVVSISPTQPTVSVSAGTPVTLTIAVTQDDPSDVLTASVSSSSNCGSDCGSFGAISGTPGSGAYTVQFSPPSSVSASMEIINVSSILSNSTQGTAFVTISP